MWDMVDKFYHLNNDAERVDQVFLNVGTNDIKNAWEGVGKLESQVLKLVQHIKKLFPRATVLLISVLPMKLCKYYTARNFLQFNNILRYVSAITNSVFIDCFSNFLDNGDIGDRDINTRLFRDNLHLNKRGIGVFCVLFKNVINIYSKT